MKSEAPDTAGAMRRFTVDAFVARSLGAPVLRYALRLIDAEDDDLDVIDVLRGGRGRCSCRRGCGSSGRSAKRRAKPPGTMPP